MNRKEAEDFVYKSYLKAEKYQCYDTKDSDKRRPDLTRDIIRKKSTTPCVLVTGSKGKGSVSNMISQILQSQFKVGMMTSPHIIDFCERFKINGQNISDKDFAKYMTIIQPYIDDIEMNIPKNVCISPMGIQTILSLEFFNNKHTDFNVFECGKGAKYDDVNNIIHQYAVINRVFLEHTRELGNTLEMIADDKSYVINGDQKCVYIADQADSVMEILKRRSHKFDTPIKRYGEDFRTENIRYLKEGMLFDVYIEENRYTDISIPLLGEHQARNCALAMAFCRDVLGEFDLRMVKQKLLEIDCGGRMEIISTDPFVLLDACINASSCLSVKNVLKHIGIEDATVIIGIPDDKDYAGVVREMNSMASSIILTKSQNPHYIFTDEQVLTVEKEGIQAVWAESINAAFDIAKKIQRPIVILGTTSVISEVKRCQFPLK